MKKLILFLFVVLSFVSVSCSQPTGGAEDPALPSAEEIKLAVASNPEGSYSGVNKKEGYSVLVSGDTVTMYYKGTLDWSVKVIDVIGDYFFFVQCEKTRNSVLPVGSYAWFSITDITYDSVTMCVYELVGIDVFSDECPCSSLDRDKAYSCYPSNLKLNSSMEFYRE